MKNKLVFLLLILLLLSLNLSTTANSEKLKVHFIDVGQGDSTLIQFPNQKTMLIDGGKNNSGPKISNYLRNLEVNKIDYLVATHPHADHIGGLDYIINNFKIDKIYMPNVTHTTKTFRDLLLAIKNKGKQINTAQAELRLINNPQLNLTVKLIGPTKTNYDNLNNYSTIITINYQNNSFLFTGDAETKSEFELINSSANLQADLLKVGHHGSSTSTGELFLRKVNPKFAVISVEKDNKYGLPDSKVINRLKRHQINIYRTDQQGTIIATSNGRKITFNTEAHNNSKEKEISTSNNKIKISYLSLSEEIVKIINTSQKDIDISGWQLVSVKGNQTFTFPTGTTIQAGEFLKVVSGRGKTSGPNKLVWTGRYIWNNDGDQAKLYNEQQQLISQY